MLEARSSPGHASPLMAFITSRFVEVLSPAHESTHSEAMGDRPVRDIIDTIRHLRLQTSDELLGLGSTRCPLGTYALMIEMAVRCATLRDALTMSFRFMALATSAVEFELIEQENHAIIEIRESLRDRDHLGLLADWSAIVWSKFPQWLIGGPITFEQAEFAHPPYASVALYESTFSCRPSFNRPHARLTFSRTYLDRSVVRDVHDAQRLNINPEGFATPKIGISDSLTGQIRKIWRQELAHGHSPSSIDILAQQFGVSGQTLRRRLNDEGVSYRDLKAQTRCESAH